ncbi:pyruvate/2-oxoglutarate dehydrogenase complex dihydrolipoamide dehydrogenase (E3) component [Nocardioides marinisabuli]|uniref:Pyruvate/2-oxoglutarate dehydrogenase complex dihydrolipoamide dehydrogenase (E3) component n=1 Tax=Nocardioides marinisabuli TaxID=419476 RepID=A0A7Y9EZM7_9ACTN|nr:FAD-dependent oxidoreductase [Nocardioides marinisabuli]NYD56671.1 pyruvate/2-oxoglutarate dehydrogenase complex dihydrolipoamide dehydrogenase (E3) component [Nocardioides marinisabuli]
MTATTRTPGSPGSPEAAARRSDPLTTPDGAPWDLLVVGGGTAGLVAAHTAAGFGARTLLVERHRTGGDCLWTGCVPSKALLAAAHAAAAARQAPRLGVHVGDVRVDFAEVMRHVHATIERIEPVDSPERLRGAGVAVAHGSVVMTGPQSAVVDGEPVRFAQALLATGSSPSVPGIPGLADSDPLTSDDVWDLTELPGRLLVLGGGPIGCELGQAFARLGSRVDIVEAGPRILGPEDAHAAALVRASLRADGVELHEDVSLERVEGVPGGVTAHLSDGTRLQADRVLVAVGRAPGTRDLDLAAAGVELTERGHVVVDGALRTTNPRIWAAGDLTGHPAFTHVAGMHGSLAASNAVLGLRRKVRLDTVPRVTYTQPEVASFGVGTESDDPSHTVHRVDAGEVDRAVAEDDTDGEVAVVLDGRGRLVGARVVGPRAGEVLAELTLAAQAGVSLRTVAGTIHPYPAWSDGVSKAALSRTREELAKPVPATVTRVLARGRRRWVQHRASAAAATPPAR